MNTVAIHKGGPWAGYWRRFCTERGIAYKDIDGYSSSVLAEVRDCTALMWHIDQTNPVDLMVASYILTAAEHMGLRTFPNTASRWHFDDKIAQKYLFESHRLPTVPTWVFYSLSDALAFLEHCDYPIVAKLRRGAGSYNVRLLSDHTSAAAYARRMFTTGYSAIPRLWTDVASKARCSLQKGGIRAVGRRILEVPRFLSWTRRARRMLTNERGYVYLQQFLPNNRSDVRVTVVGERAWGFRRMTRNGDFRASGSGLIEYDPRGIPLQLVLQSIAIAKLLAMESVCFDWLLDGDGTYRFVEISYTFLDEAVHACPGYWDSEGRWHEGHIHPSMAIAELVLLS